jgi:hypothetical protein
VGKRNLPSPIPIVLVVRAYSASHSGAACVLQVVLGAGQDALYAAYAMAWNVPDGSYAYNGAMSGPRIASGHVSRTIHFLHHLSHSPPSLLPSNPSTHPTKPNAPHPFFVQMELSASLDLSRVALASGELLSVWGLIGQPAVAYLLFSWDAGRPHLPLTCVAVSPDGSKMVAGTADGSLTLWDISGWNQGETKGGKGGREIGVC